LTGCITIRVALSTTNTYPSVPKRIARTASRARWRASSAGMAPRAAIRSYRVTRLVAVCTTSRSLALPVGVQVGAVADEDRAE
jgi:hypothetical protein